MRYLQTEITTVSAANSNTKSRTTTRQPSAAAVICSKRPAGRFGEDDDATAINGVEPNVHPISPIKENNKNQSLPPSSLLPPVELSIYKYQVPVSGMTYYVDNSERPLSDDDEGDLQQHPIPSHTPNSSLLTLKAPTRKVSIGEVQLQTIEQHRQQHQSIVKKVSNKDAFNPRSSTTTSTESSLSEIVLPGLRHDDASSDQQLLPQAPELTRSETEYSTGTPELSIAYKGTTAKKTKKIQKKAVIEDNEKRNQRNKKNLASNSGHSVDTSPVSNLSSSSEMKTKKSTTKKKKKKKAVLTTSDDTGDGDNPPATLERTKTDKVSYVKTNKMNKMTKRRNTRRTSALEMMIEDKHFEDALNELVSSSSSDDDDDDGKESTGGRRRKPPLPPRRRMAPPRTSTGGLLLSKLHSAAQKFRINNKSTSGYSSN